MTTHRELMVEDLAKSGLSPEDIEARPIDIEARVACGISDDLGSGYLIPYYDIYGNPIEFYRLRMFKRKVKYLQAKSSANHVYFPKNFMKVFSANKGRYVLVMEGEKKAALACKLGFPAIGFGGVDSWKTRSIIIPKDAELDVRENGAIAVKIPAGTTVVEDIVSPYAMGFSEFLELCQMQNTTVVICYDSDVDSKVHTNVQKAAAKLGFELRGRNFPATRIRQLLLPFVGEKSAGKTSFDDYIMHPDGGLAKFAVLLQKTMDAPSAFPRHPEMREYITKVLQRAKVPRKEMHDLSLAIMAELDAKGVRMLAPEEERMYYFDREHLELMRVPLNAPNPGALQDSPFGKLLYRDYGISPAADSRLVDWLGAQFGSEAPVQPVSPKRIFGRNSFAEDSIRVQISDGEYIEVSGDLEEPLKVFRNGDQGILFEKGHVIGIDSKEVMRAYHDLKDKPLKNWWREVLEDVRLESQGKSADLISYLYYISPWLHRWRGTQLPVEICIGESGSGKSTLFELRLGILTGDSKLRNPPNDVRDWQASIANTGGLHVSDNVQLLDKQLRQKLSDEICRLVTEPNPMIEFRKLYSDAGIARMYISTVFAFTAIVMPFMNADLIQRSHVIRLDKMPDQEKEIWYEMNWGQMQLERYGGRAYWLAHQLLVIHKFFARLNKWDSKYRAKHRLINYEQSMRAIAEIFGETDTTWIPDAITNAMNANIGKTDLALEGLKAFSDDWASKHADRLFTVKEIAEWVSISDEYDTCEILKNTRSLGRYITNNKHMVKTVGCIVEQGKYANTMRYKVISPGKVNGHAVLS